MPMTLPVFFFVCIFRSSAFVCVYMCAFVRRASLRIDSVGGRTYEGRKVES